MVSESRWFGGGHPSLWLTPMLCNVPTATAKDQGVNIGISCDIRTCYTCNMTACHRSYWLCPRWTMCSGSRPLAVEYLFIEKNSSRVPPAILLLPNQVMYYSLMSTIVILYIGRIRRFNSPMTKAPLVLSCTNCSKHYWPRVTDFQTP